MERITDGCAVLAQCHWPVSAAFEAPWAVSYELIYDYCVDHDHPSIRGVLEFATEEPVRREPTSRILQEPEVPWGCHVTNNRQVLLLHSPKVHGEAPIAKRHRMLRFDPTTGRSAE